jgi:hypothetical protein
VTDLEATLGVLQISMAIRLRNEIPRKWLMRLAGAALILFGAFVVPSLEPAPP